MKFTASWLNNFVSLDDIDSTQLSDKLTMLGLEVDGVEETFTELESFVTCRLLKVSKHPDADKLTICEVEADNGENFEVVCGAPNVREGMITALAKPGTKLPNGTKIKKSKVRGVVSLGMLCSASELNLSEDHTGIMDLDESIAPGIPLATALGLRDTVIEVDLTPNRPDCASVYGIAREVAGFTGRKLNAPIDTPTELTGEGIDYKVIVEDSSLCPRYTARKLNNVTIGASPEWMQHQLLAVGMRPINNIVDITNYVMLEMGQPLHAFDFDKLRGQTVVVRPPKNNEKHLITLDNIKRDLDEDMLMICDAEGPVAVAGVMGGLNSEVTQTTTTILIESACFNPVSVRKTARKLNIPSEASYRFERGVDPNLAHQAMERAVQLIVKYGNATADATGIDVYPGEKVLLELPLRTKKVNSLLGINLKQEQIAQYLKDIEFTVAADGDDSLVTVPSFRIDIEREIDLVEEIARLVGYNEIPTTQPTIAMHYPKRDALRELRNNLCSILTSHGYYEAINYSFVTDKHFDAFALEDNDFRRNATHLLNPLSEEQNIMRTMLLPGLLENVRRNINFQQPDIKLFEIGKTFFAREKGELPTEKQQLCAVITGNRFPDSESLYFSDFTSDFFDIKGVTESIIRTTRIAGKSKNLTFHIPEDLKTIEPYCDPSCILEIKDGKSLLGIIGRVNQKVVASFNIKQPVFFLEFDLDQITLLPKKDKQFIPLPKFPSVKRDIALLIPDNVAGGQLVDSIYGQKQKLVESVQLFDVYRGKSIEEGYKSVALSVTYRSATKTLQDKAVEKVHKNIVNNIMTKFNARYREGTEA